MWQSVEYYKALANPKRLAILKLLEEHEQSVGEIVYKLKLRQSNVSQHLRLLRRVGIIKKRRKGKYLLYQLEKRAL